MNKIALSIIVAGILGNIALADEIDDEIQRVEKENKILELQRKKKQLEMQNQQIQNQIVNQNNTQSKDSLTSKAKVVKVKKVKDPNSKNGFFIGVEGTLGTSKNDFRAHTRDTCDGSTYCNMTNFFEASNATFDLGLMGGYQHYFGDSKRHGIKVSAHIYSGFGNDWKFTWKDNAPDYSKDDGSFIVVTRTGTISYVPIKFGFDVKYLWDFLQEGKHTLGLNVGVGYESDTYVNGKSGFGEVFDNIFLNNVYPVIGLHYYCGHHQFELMYRFGGILGQTGNQEVYYEEYIIPRADSDKTPPLIGISSYDIKLLNQSYLTVNYAYRF
ncbi:hypothetical protein BKH42_08590 [Helicobacter sp. 13S00482-2]|uniref:outer membrane beta-barrel protein n=1 Tax=Helicobacter sp. 13S00482-2 TaxID=1476200 RepID=UPI000BA6790E|nr:outer membrane beta-barrel protein [Helicobacter sp. 13S00482-2]PAF52940.1 hypothetical protein BKH42_08590 [Helicobacter sp. 13S00482-2]